MTIRISSGFDAGAIVVVDTVRAELAQQIDLRLRKDSHADIAQWFYFRLQGARGEQCIMRLLNAGEATYPDGWKDYQAVASYDRENWFRVTTTFDGEVMTITHVPQADSIYYAYFEPYSWDRHLTMLGRAQASPLVHIENLGGTVDGRDLDMLTIGDAAAARKIWVIARQHPGEAMAEWFAEGMIEALLDIGNPVARELLQHAVFHIVPNMNPDGAINGNLRTNAAGANLNREWMTPSLATSPEIFHVRNRIHATGCNLFLDIHGDEGLPYVFVAGSEMLEGFSEKQKAEQQAFIDDLLQANADFQTRFGYPSGKYREDMLKLASKYIGHTFKCVSLTLEMPFKDNADAPQPEVGWNGARSARLGRDMLVPILGHLRRSRQ
ncbi:M14 family metallopeptidase [Oxalicibacterium solurbis]|uniref:Peptidase n=1 Tax=Oxalicibacterium solurbis TaxID=69280 RepID=A0A8J3F4W4_9BURK|nr:M14-type cytosolic carboxypeptidase [Oxalicibacterium solurbis]GGI52981.1 peptidase [Oxalicibacterium solurbis]